MKQWPKDSKKMADMGDVLKHVKKAVLFLYDLQRKNEGKDVPYEGYDHDQTHCVPDAEEMLTASGIAYHEERGRDAMDVILQLTFLLGMEQGRRLTLEQLSPQVGFIKSYNEVVRQQIEALDSKMK